MRHCSPRCCRSHADPETRSLLAADVVGFQQLAGSDEERTLARLRALRSDLIDPTIAVHNGRIVKRTGDGVLIEVRSVVDAVRCAIEMQNGMIERIERASPVISETASRPPHPVARTSPAANTRRPRSSSFEPTDSHLCRIACVSIMPARIRPQRHPGNPIAPSQITTGRPRAIRFTCCDGCP